MHASATKDTTAEPEKRKGIYIGEAAWQRARLEVLDRKREDPHYSIKRFIEEAIHDKVGRAA